jgi:hypothetical protein
MLTKRYNVARERKKLPAPGVDYILLQKFASAKPLVKLTQCLPEGKAFKTAIVLSSRSPRNNITEEQLIKIQGYMI